MGKKLCKITIWMMGVIVCFIMLVCPVKADLIWEPMGDAFYEEHAGECEYRVRSYTTNGPEGKVIVYKSPEDAMETAVIENGKVVSVSYTYTDANGVKWGVYENWETGEQGWLPMDYMEVVYDHISFEEDYGELIKEQEGTLSKEFSGQTLLIWDYPGAKKGKEFPTGEMDMPTYHVVYVDEAGHSWGKIGYYYGCKNCWICIDVPTADYETLYPTGSAVQEKLAEEQLAKEQEMVVEEEVPQIVPKQNNQLVVLVTVIVGAVVVVTGGLLVVLKKRGK